MKRWVISFIVVAGVFMIGAAAYVYSGLYDIGADAPHWSATEQLIETVREQSIERRTKDIQVPDLENPQLVLKGAGQYAAMCVTCHLAPGIKNSEMRPGMYPQPPNLSQARVDPKVAFWTIKHGIKMSAMPAWGEGHDDATIWSMVAFINKLPEMSPEQYQAITAKASPDEKMQPEGAHAKDGHAHGGAKTGRGH